MQDRRTQQKMAMIAVEVALEKLITFLSNEAQSLSNVRQRVNGLKNDLERMRSFLQDAESRGEKNQGLKTWIKQVRDVSYETEDVLEEFLLLLIPPHNQEDQNAFLHVLSSSLFHLRRLKTRYLLSSRIETIKDKIKGILECNIVFSLKSNHELDDLRLDALFIDDTSVVGIDDSKTQLISLLKGGHQDLSILSVVGMGGVGKTTLVRKVYQSRTVKEYFDCQAWITVSKSFTVLELLQSSLKSFMNENKEQVNEGIFRMNEIELIDNLKNYLVQKRYIIVFDDIWSVDAWEKVRFAFPCCLCGSRIVFTTRVGDIASSTETINHVFNLGPLGDQEAWTLFCRKVFRGGEYNGVCPEEMYEISWSLMKKCGGLPLAIVALGGLLARKEKHVLEWQKIFVSLFAETESNSGLESLERILLLSYNDLPYHLKFCILYTSMFPEDYLIKRMKLIRLWVSEGFVKDKPGYTREEVAEHYLNELVNRSMIQIVRKDSFNRVNTCQIHDVMREVVQRKSRDESFAIVMNDRTLSPIEKVHRVAIYENFDHLETFKGNLEMLFTGRLRSILLFDTFRFNANLLNGCRSLRVLELENAPLYKFPRELTQMIHLKYLSLRRTGITKIPYSIRKLRSLEILDLKFCHITSLSKGILKLKNLCQLRCYKYHFYDPTPFFATSTGVQVPLGIGNLTKLEKLCSVEMNQEENDNNVLVEMGNLTNLKRLGILKLTGQNGAYVSSSLDKLNHLTSLLLSTTSNTEPLSLTPLSNPPMLLQRLFLKGYLKSLPSWIICLRYLGKLVLQYSKLKEDPLRALQGLPNLVVLDLRDAYLGEELSCDIGGYPKLKVLCLRRLHGLGSVVLPEGAMSRLQELQIVECRNLEIVPTGIEHCRDLEYMLLSGMPTIFIQNIERGQGPDFWKVEHIGVIQVFPY
ncbi:disease resistance protein RPM1-like [Impatiens glandulifera]|uniref:disease resistance protein RPM1-like n=1 Tax=Impatiens glandulifera TaxID=253017 RepID=UPI001FB0931F|nr:disease resistance protein RPM1-like [Impatiens glandulifera]